MKAKWIRILMLGLAACARGDNGYETRTIWLTNLPALDALQLVRPYVGEAEAISATNNPNAVTVTAPPDRLDEIQNLLRQYDRTPPIVTLHYRLIEADGFEGRDSAIADIEGALRKLFRFNGYRLASQTALRSQAQSSAVQLVTGMGSQVYAIAADVGRIARGENGGSVEVRTSVYLGKGTSGTPDFQTMLTIPVGQTVVLGSVPKNLEGGTVILAMRPEIE